MPDKNTKQSPHEIELPQSIIESFARFLVPEIRKYYNSEQGQQEFEKWKEQNTSAENENGKTQPDNTLI